MQVTIENLQKTYNGQTVLDIPGLNVKQGELLGIVGNNGAGKTTLLRLVLDLIRPEKGHVNIGDHKVNESTTWKKHTGSYLDEGFLIDFLTPEEYFYFSGKAYGFDHRQVDDALVRYDKFLGSEILGTGKFIRQLSTGNKQKVGIIAAMMVNPQLLILDEPFNFLDPSSQIMIRNHIMNQNKSSGSTMLISSHNINHLAEICTRVILLEKGIVIKDIYTGQGDVTEIDLYFHQQLS
jgi:ABC-2 type transport system ATP-binding protein